MREESKEVLVEDLEKTEREAKGMNVSRKKKQALVGFVILSCREAKGDKGSLH